MHGSQCSVVRMDKAEDSHPTDGPEGRLQRFSTAHRRQEIRLVDVRRGINFARFMTTQGNATTIRKWCVLHVLCIAACRFLLITAVYCVSEE